jgi:hypothetical protein
VKLYFWTILIIKNYIIMKLINNIFAIAIVALMTLSTADVKAQEVDFGADVVSQYVWRGTQFGAGPHVQPWMSAATGNLELGIWGSFPTTGGDAGHELDLYASYDFGVAALTVTNYTFPGAGGAYADTEGLFEDAYLEISGSTTVGPIDLTVGYFTEVEALYVEAGFSLGVVDFALGYGSDDEANAWYANGDSGLVNIAIGGSKDIKITEDYSLPLFSSFVYNPDAESAFLVFGMSF